MSAESQPAPDPRHTSGWGPTAMSEHIDRNDASSWQRWVFPGIWLAYLTQTASGIAAHSRGAAAILGYALLFVFGAAYLVTLAYNAVAETLRYTVGLGSMLVMLVVEAFLAHEDATAMCVYIGVVCIAGLGRWGWPAMGAMTAVAVFGPALVPSWHVGVQWDMAITMGAVGLAMFGYFAIMASNRALSAARSEVARLAAENERSRIARDLHDLLGHSLTTITVKAALARRLMERDPARAAQEIGEVEELTRTTLTDVRAAVAGYRDITLGGELATAQEVLRAGGIEARTPRAIDEVRPQYRELFAWVVREAVTNVLRHSRAQLCTITVGPTWLEIADDGRGALSGEGNGLRGIRERVAASGGTVTTGSGAVGGWTLRVELPPVPPPAAHDGDLPLASTVVAPGHPPRGVGAVGSAPGPSEAGPATPGAPGARPEAGDTRGPSQAEPVAGAVPSSMLFRSP